MVHLAFAWAHLSYDRVVSVSDNGEWRAWGVRSSGLCPSDRFGVGFTRFGGVGVYGVVPG